MCMCVYGKHYNARIRFENKQMIKVAHKGCVELMGEDMKTYNLGSLIYQEV